MPCYRCGTRQTDPDRGQSPWKRGVRGDNQVLVCPDCQSGRDWAADLDRCARCGTVRLVRRLGEVECKNCGHVQDSAIPAPTATTTVPPATPSATAPPVIPSQATPSSSPPPVTSATADPELHRAPAAPGAAEGSQSTLAEEVGRALDRILGATRH
jgi:uncharacterized Zn finger protein (UPF0148 family)